MQIHSHKRSLVIFTLMTPLVLWRQFLICAPSMRVMGGRWFSSSMNFNSADDWLSIIMSALLIATVQNIIY